MWIPREPDVLGQPTRPTASSASRQTSATSRICGHAHARDRVQVDPQLVGVVQVVGADRVRVQVDAAEVDDPGKRRGLVDDDLVGRPTGRERQLGRADPVGRVVRGALLEERLLGDAVDEALERHRPAADAGQRAIGDREVVVDEVELRVPRIGEVDLLRVRDRDLAAADLEDLLRRRHAPKRYARDRRARGVDSTATLSIWVAAVRRDGERRPGHRPQPALEDGAMQYALLIYTRGARPRSRPADAMAAEMEGYNAFTEHVRGRGAMKAGEALQPSATATTVRVRDGQTIATDGPFAETKEVLGGFYLVEAEDLDEAIGYAAHDPRAPAGLDRGPTDLRLRRAGAAAGRPEAVGAD